MPNFMLFEYKGIHSEYGGVSRKNVMHHYPFERAGLKYRIVKISCRTGRQSDGYGSDLTLYDEYLVLPTQEFENEEAMAIGLSGEIDRHIELLDEEQTSEIYRSFRLKDFPLAILDICEIKNQKEQMEMFQALFPDKVLKALPCNAPHDFFGWRMQQAICDGDLDKVLSYLPESYEDEDIYNVFAFAAQHNQAKIMEAMLEKISIVSNDKLFDIMVDVVKLQTHIDCIRVLARNITQLNEAQVNDLIDAACFEDIHIRAFEFIFKNYRDLIKPDKIAAILAKALNDGDYFLLHVLKTNLPDYKTFMNETIFLRKLEFDKVIESRSSVEELYNLCPTHEIFSKETAVIYYEKMIQHDYTDSAHAMLRINPFLACQGSSQKKTIAHSQARVQYLKRFTDLKEIIGSEYFEEVMRKKNEGGLTPMHQFLQCEAIRFGSWIASWKVICSSDNEKMIENLCNDFKDFNRFLSLPDENGHTPLFYLVEQVKEGENWTPIQIHAVLNKVEGMSDIGEAIKLIQTCRSQIADNKFIITPEDKPSYNETVSAALKSSSFPKLSEKLYRFGTDMKTFRKKYNEKSGINGLFKRNSRKLMVESVGNALAKFHEHPSQENLESLQTTVVMVLQGIATEKAGRPYKSESNMESLCKEIKVECDSALAYYAQYNEEKPDLPSQRF